ncbi:MAG: hypothetical protein SGJ09_12035 [Phycisphaerae bacterium]|nr:hypothetical protein [Phycisphaerae bacterium]
MPLTLRTLLAVLAPTALTLASCGTGQPASGPPATQSAPISRIQVEHFSGMAVVQAVDPATSTLQLLWSDGVLKNYTAGQNLANFSELRVGDSVKACVVEELVVYIGSDAASPSAGGGTSAQLVPRGNSTALVLARTHVISERIVGLDQINRTITLQAASEPPRTLNMAAHLGMSRLRVGEVVVIRVTDAISVSIEKQ